MKYILEIKPAYEDSFKGLIILGAKDSNYFVDTLMVDDLEELNSDYISKHFSDLQGDAYHRGLEDGKAQAERGCEGCKYEGRDLNKLPCMVCSKSRENCWTAKQTDNCIEIGDEVEWDGDKYIVTYRNMDINTGVIQDYDLMMWDGSVVDHVKKCSFVKTGNHYDISSILKEMQS